MELHAAWPNLFGEWCVPKIFAMASSKGGHPSMADAAAKRMEWTEHMLALQMLERIDRAHIATMPLCIAYMERMCRDV